VPFNVPAETERLAVIFRYTGKEEHTTLDLGIEDPRGIMGWSGGNKNSFTISETDATPSYLPGEMIARQWKLLIGVPNSDGTCTSQSGHGVPCPVFCNLGCRAAART
jgi:hypothetical protein